MINEEVFLLGSLVLIVVALGLWLTKPSSPPIAMSSKKIPHTQTPSLTKDNNYFKFIIQKANENNPEYQNELAKAYLLGIYTHQDYPQAIYWFEKAAVNGNEDSIAIIATAYMTGDSILGIKKDYVKGIYWTKKVAQSNTEEKDSRILASLILGDMYFKGDEIPKNLEQAFQWYKLAAELGDKRAQYIIGCMYLYGDGVTKNIKNGIAWLEKAGNQNNAEAAALLSRLSMQAHNYHTAFTWALIAETGNYGDLYTEEFNLGLLYYNGYGIPRDYKKAAFWFEQAAKKGLPEAQYNLGELYLQGTGVLKDTIMGYAWINVAIANGFTQKYASLTRDYIFSSLPDSQRKLANETSSDLWYSYGKNISLTSGRPLPNLDTSATSHFMLQPGDTIYKVKENDTIESIATRFDVTPSAILYANSTKNLNLTYGAMLVIPTHKN